MSWIQQGNQPVSGTQPLPRGMISLGLAYQPRPLAPISTHLPNLAGDERAAAPVELAQGGGRAPLRRSGARRDLGAISARSRRDLGAISARSRRDLGALSARSRRDLGAISARSWRDLGAISARSRRDLGSLFARWRLCSSSAASCSSTPPRSSRSFGDLFV